LKNTDKIENITKNEKKRIVGIVIAAIVVVVIIATILVIKEYKTKATEKNISTQDDTKAGISIEFTYDEDYWKKYDLTNAVYKTQEEYENAVRNYLDEIAILLNKQDWYEKYTGMNTLCLELHINDLDDGSTQEGISSYKESKKQSTFTYDLNLSSTMFTHNRSQLVHALSDLVITKTQGISSAMDEGLADYIQNDLGMGVASVNYGIDIHNYLIEYTKVNENNNVNKMLFDFIKNNVGAISHNSESSYYTKASATPDYKIINEYKNLCIDSFVDYLIQTYGMESVIKIIDGYDNSIYNLYNQNGLSGLVTDWKQFLENYNCKMTWDEIDASITVLKK